MIDLLNFNTQITSFERNPEVCNITELDEYDNSSVKDKPVKEINVAELKKLISKNPGTKIIDLRDEEDTTDIGFETIAIPHYEIGHKISFLTGSDPVVFHCKTGSRSMNVINYLKEIHNLDNLYSLIL